MRKLPKLLAGALAIAAIFNCLGAPGAASSGAMTKVDVMVMVDDTVSMQKNDSNEIAKVALEQFVNILPASGSRAGIATYNDGIMKNQPIIEVEGDESRKILKTFAKGSLTQQGEFTDLPMALEYAVEQLQAVEDNGSRQAIVAVTDGENDFRNKTYGERLAEANLKVVRNSGIPIYLIVINFSDEARGYAREIAESTGGAVYFADNGDQLSDQMLDIQKKIFNTTDGPTIDGRIDPGQTFRWQFPLKDGIFEANILLNHTEGLDLDLTKPDGTVLPLMKAGGSAPQYDDVSVVKGTDSTVIKVLQPTAGDYVLEMDTYVEQHVIGEIIEYEDIHVQVELSSDTVDAGKDISVTATLMWKDTVYTDLDFAQISATLEWNGQTYSMDREEDSFVYKLSVPDQAGKYETVVSLVGSGSFQLSSGPVSFTVRDPVPSVPISSPPVWTNPAVTASASPEPSPVVRDDPDPILVLPIVLIVLGIIAVAVFVLLLVIRRKPESDYVQLRGTLVVTYYDQNSVWIWQKFVQPGAYCSLERPQASLGKMLRDLQDGGVIPEEFDRIMVSGRKTQSGIAVEIKGEVGTPDQPEKLNVRLNVNTGMDDGGFIGFTGNNIEVYHFLNGRKLEFEFT